MDKGDSVLVPGANLTVEAWVDKVSASGVGNLSKTEKLGNMPRLKMENPPIFTTNSTIFVLLRNVFFPTHCSCSHQKFHESLNSPRCKRPAWQRHPRQQTDPESSSEKHMQIVRSLWEFYKVSLSKHCLTRIGTC